MNEIEKLKREIEIKDRYMDLIWCLGYDYDGYESPEGLKHLIDELVELASKGLKCDDECVMFYGDDKKYNILDEEIENV